MRLSEFGWVGGHWDVLEKIYPKALTTPLPEKTRALAGTVNPVIRGDWLSEAVNDPRLYYQLIGMPQKLSELAKLNGVDIDNDLRTQRARRAIIRNSDVTRGNRLVERHSGGRGGFWISYDFATSTGDQDLFERPLGPKSSNAVKAPFKPDSLRVMFALPNGFLATALYDAAGSRIDRVLPGVDKPIYSGASEQSQTAGPACMACHINGVKPVRDDYASQSAGRDSPPAKEAREAALLLAGTDAELQLFARCRQRALQERTGCRRRG